MLIAKSEDVREERERRSQVKRLLRIAMDVHVMRQCSS